PAPRGLDAPRPEAGENDGPDKKGGPLARGADDRAKGQIVEEPAADAIYTQRPEHTADDLRAWLEQHRDAARIEVRLTGDLNLSARDGKGGPGLLVQAKERVVIKGQGARRPALRLSYDAGWTGDRFVALQVNARESS